MHIRTCFIFSKSSWKRCFWLPLQPVLHPQHLIQFCIIPFPIHYTFECTRVLSIFESMEDDIDHVDLPPTAPLHPPPPLPLIPARSPLLCSHRRGKCHKCNHRCRQCCNCPKRPGGRPPRSVTPSPTDTTRRASADGRRRPPTPTVLFGDDNTGTNATNNSFHSMMLLSLTISAISHCQLILVRNITSKVRIIINIH